MTARVIGVYIDIAGATTLAEARICRVMETEGGKLVMEAVDDDGMASMARLLQSLNAIQLQQVLDEMHGPRTELAS